MWRTILLSNWVRYVVFMGSGTGAGSEELVEQLHAEGVIEATSDGEGLKLTSEFSTKLSEYSEDVDSWDDAQIRAELRELTGFDEESDALLEVAEANESIIAEYFALSSVESLTHADRLRVLTVFDSLREDAPPASGAPEAFLPVHGDRVPFLVNIHDRSIVYIWMDDCDPCDLMREDFNDIFEEPPEDIALFGVYGPDVVELFYEEYSVDGAPTTLFFLNGEVDARLRGAYYKRVTKKEIKKLRDIEADVKQPNA